MKCVKFDVHDIDSKYLAELLSMSLIIKDLKVDSIRIDGELFNLKRLRRDVRRLA